MSAVVLKFGPIAGRLIAADRVAQRGYSVIYRHGYVNHCPGCGRSHWWVGRVSAECAFCDTAIPFDRPREAPDQHPFIPVAMPRKDD